MSDRLPAAVAAPSAAAASGRRHYFAPPRLTGRWRAVWQRNFLVWKKLMIPSLLGNLADPLIYMLGLGYGLGALLPEVSGTRYVAFLAAGTVCFSTMNAASFEALYSAFSRMHVQKTWEAILNAPMALDDIVAGELVWAACKSLLSGVAILAVIGLLGLAGDAGPAHLLAVVAVVFLTGLCFSALGLIVTALAPSYDFFMYYFTLFVTPMGLLSGVFFPLDQMPPALQTLSAALPLTHSVALVRPLLAGAWPAAAALHAGVLLAIAGVAFWLAVALARRRLLR
jgi:lipooligosaccharide transport system permease protein